MNQSQQHNREKEDGLELKGKREREHRRRQRGSFRLYEIQAQNDEADINRIALTPACAVNQHRRQCRHDEKHRNLRLFRRKITCRLHHRQRKPVIKEDGEQLHQIQILERCFGNQEQHILINQVVIPDVFAQRFKSARPENIQPADQKGLVIRRNIIQHGHPRQSRHADDGAGQPQLSRRRLFQLHKAAEHDARRQRKQRGNRRRLPP